MNYVKKIFLSFVALGLAQPTSDLRAEAQTATYACFGAGVAGVVLDMWRAHSEYQHKDRQKKLKKQGQTQTQLQKKKRSFVQRYMTQLRYGKRPLALLATGVAVIGGVLTHSLHAAHSSVTESTLNLPHEADNTSTSLHQELLQHRVTDRLDPDLFAQLPECALPPQDSCCADTKKFPDEVVGQAITIKKMKPEYVQEYCQMFTPEVQRTYYVGGVCLDAKTVERELNYLNIGMQRGDRIIYAVFDNADAKLIGSVQIVITQNERCGQFAWWINPQYQGHGRAREAATLLIQNYFVALPEKQAVSATVAPHNPKSFRALASIGFKTVGRMTRAGSGQAIVLTYPNPARA